MNTRLRTLIGKLQALPPQRQSEVEDFIDFLEQREARSRLEASRRLGDAFAKLDALNDGAMSEAEIQAEIDAVRAKRRVHADSR